MAVRWSVGAATPRRPPALSRPCGYGTIVAMKAILTLTDALAGAVAIQQADSHGLLSDAWEKDRRA